MTSVSTPYPTEMRQFIDPYHPLSNPPSCCRGSIVGVDPDTNQVIIIPATCGRWDCPDCAPRKASNVAARLFAAKPERHLTLTWDPKVDPDVDHAIAKMKAALPRLVSELRAGKYDKDGHEIHKPIAFQYCAIWELHLSGYPHIHIAQWGDYVPYARLRNIWHRLTGAIIVYIKYMYEEMPDHHHWTKYLLKAIPKNRSRFANLRMVSFSRDYDRNPKDTPLGKDPKNCNWYLLWREPGEIKDVLTMYHGATEVTRPGGVATFQVPGSALPVNRSALDWFLDGDNARRFRHSDDADGVPEDPHPLATRLLQLQILGMGPD